MAGCAPGLDEGRVKRGSSAVRDGASSEYYPLQPNSGLTGPPSRLPPMPLIHCGPRKRYPSAGSSFETRMIPRSGSGWVPVPDSAFFATLGRNLTFCSRSMSGKGTASEPALSERPKGRTRRDVRKQDGSRPLSLELAIVAARRSCEECRVFEAHLLRVPPGEWIRRNVGGHKSENQKLVKIRLGAMLQS